MIGWMFTPGKRWFQLFDLVTGIILDRRRRREERGRR